RRMIGRDVAASTRGTTSAVALRGSALHAEHLRVTDRRGLVQRQERALHSAVIIGVGQSAYTRRPAPGQATHTFIRDAVVAALADAGIAARDVQGMAVASFSLAPDTAVDLAWKLGLSLRWLLQDTNGGSSAMNMLGHALRGIDGGSADVILVIGGDATGLAGDGRIAANCNIATHAHLAPLGHGGPNRLLALGGSPPH